MPIVNLQRRRLPTKWRRRPRGFGLPGATSEAQEVSNLHWASRYAAAAVAASLSAFLHLFLGDFVARTPFMLYVPAVVAAGIYGGCAPALFATLLCAASALLIGAPGLLWSGLDGSRMAAPLTIFLLVGLAISYLTYLLHRAISASRGKERSFKSVVERVTDYAIFLLDPSGRVASWNSGAERIKGYTADEIIGESVARFYTPADQASRKPERALAEAAREGTFTEEGWRVRKDGSRFWASVVVTAVKDENGDLIGYSKIVRDLTERKNAEEAALERSESALQASEAKYKSLFESMDEGFCLIEMLFDDDGRARDFRFLEANPAFQRQTGLAQPVGKRARDVIPGHEARWAAIYGRVAKTGRAARFEEREALLDRWFEVYSWQYGDPRENRVAVLFNDITTRKRYEETILENNARLKLFFEYSPVELAMFDPEMRYIAVSERWLSAYGLAGKHVLGRGHYELFPELPERWKAIHRRALAGELIQEDEDSFKGPDGSVQWIRWEVRPWRHADGRIGGIIIFSENITERKRAREDLRRSERQLRTIIDEMPALISYIDRDERYVFNNRRYGEWWGKGPGELAGKPARELVGPEVYARYEPLVKRALAGENVVFEGEIELKGGKRWIRSEFVPDRDPDGLVRGFFVFGTDVTDAKRRSEELAEAVRARTKELRLTVTELESFSYTVSHDLRAPLRAIQGYAYLVLERAGGSLDPEAVDLLKRIEKSASRMDRLVKDVLVFSEIGRAAPEIKAVSLDSIVEHVVKNYEGIRTADVGVAAPLGRVRGQETLLTQIVSNLLENAVKFVPDGRRAEVSVWTERPKPGRLRLVVEDRGIGISPEHQGRVFHPFVRLASGRYAGTGIGLAIVKRAAEAVGGQVGLSSTPGKGSRFWIDFTEAPDGP